MCILLQGRRTSQAIALEGWRGLVWDSRATKAKLSQAQHRRGAALQVEGVQSMKEAVKAVLVVDIAIYVCFKGDESAPVCVSLIPGFSFIPELRAASN